METGIKVLDAMTRLPITVSPQATLEACAQLMDKHNVGSLLVVEDKKLIGILTERDFVRRVVSKNVSPASTQVSSVMTKNIVCISPDLDIFRALEHMREYDVRHVPVIHQENLLGFLTIKDVLRIQPDLFDLVVERYQIRESEKKPLPEKFRVELYND
ncbi:MAG: cyclic nucleotide-binding/CBS domain-containing protein [Candidatus Woesearchaeota archaeon]